MPGPIAFIPPLGADGLTGPLYTIDEDGGNAAQLEAPLWGFVTCGASKLIGTFSETIFSDPHLKVMNRDGSGMTEITNLPDDITLFIPYGLSPNNKQLAMVFIEGGSFGVEGIAVVNIDNSGYRRIPLGISNATHIDDQAAGGIRWAPDGQRFVYVAYSSVVFATRVMEIHYCNLSGGGVTVLATGPAGTDWYLMDLFKNGKHVLAKHINRTSHQVTLHKLGYDGSDEILFTDPTGSIINAGSLENRDAVLSPSNQEVLLATHAGLSKLSLSDGSLRSIYSGLPVYRVSWDPPVLVPGSIGPGPGAVGHVRLG